MRGFRQGNERKGAIGKNANGKTHRTHRAIEAGGSRGGDEKLKRYEWKRTKTVNNLQALLSPKSDKFYDVER